MQKKAQDVILAYDNIRRVLSTLERVRQDVDDHHRRWYEQAVAMAAEADVQPCMPRICRRQTERANPGVNGPEAYYCTTITIPILDHLIGQMRVRFSGLNETAARGLVLVPSAYFRQPAPDARKLVCEFARRYEDDLPAPYVDDTSVEVELASSEPAMVNQQNITSAQDALKATPKAMWPILHELLVILCTVPTTTVELVRRPKWGKSSKTESC